MSVLSGTLTRERMRWVTHIPALLPDRPFAKRVVIVRNPKSIRYIPEECAVSFIGHYSEGDDGPSIGGSAYETVELAMAEIQEYFDEPLQWHEIPDQLPGCQDDWIGPVRIFRDEQGRKILHRWQRLIDGEWVEFTGPTGGYGLQIS